MSSRTARILIAEDEAPLRNLVRLSLEMDGHEVVAVGDGEAALIRFDAEPFDLVILDIMMPKANGFTVCQEIRRRSDVPIIMLTALGSTEDLVKGFELGADDYIAKPFTFNEVQARIQAILRRARWDSEKQTPEVIVIGRVRLDVDAHQAAIDGTPIHLTPVEVRLLHTLMANVDRPVDKAELYRKVWGYDFVGGTNLLEVSVRRLREKIELDPSKPSYILTVRGTGYKFCRPE